MKIKSKQIKSYQKKTTLNKILWFVENYLPQKNKITSFKESPLRKLESGIMKKSKNPMYGLSHLLTKDFSNVKLTFTFGKWALPYLNILKKVGLIK